VFNLGMGEITVILLLALIFLGPSKLPDLAAGLGKLIREVRKATSDIKNEISLDDTFRKPFEDLRDAVTLHPDELKRRDQWRKDQEEAAKRAADAAKLAEQEAARVAAEQAAAAPQLTDGLESPPKLQGVPLPEPTGAAKADTAAAPGGLSSFAPVAPAASVAGAASVASAAAVAGPNDTIVQAVPPRAATLDDVPTPPPEVVKDVAKVEPPKLARPAAPPMGTIPRAPSGAIKAAAPVAAPVAAANSDNASNVTQILKEEDLIPSVTGRLPPPPPHLPGLRPAPPLPPPGADKKKA
jgi:sec-independent protein translocase protein TatB